MIALCRPALSGGWTMCTALLARWSIHPEAGEAGERVRARRGYELGEDSDRAGCDLGEAGVADGDDPTAAPRGQRAVAGVQVAPRLPGGGADGDAVAARAPAGQGGVLAGASRIIAVDVNPQKLALAEKFGATDVIDSTKSNGRCT